ncbi:MAG TPA: pre-peptidase C-terminal domain-containing protein, partial [Candidatus Thermoplasmatota archaeon]|nr:pre-peptidase C-terminal domain-containing protein [Candidatus Thermoplasmatota archaeon]
MPEPAGKTVMVPSADPTRSPTMSQVPGPADDGEGPVLPSFMPDDGPGIGFNPRDPAAQSGLDPLMSPYDVSDAPRFRHDKGDPDEMDPNDLTKAFSDAQWPRTKGEPFAKEPGDYTCPGAKTRAQAGASLSTDPVNCVVIQCGDAVNLLAAPTTPAVPPCMPTDCVILPGSSAAPCVPEQLCLGVYPDAAFVDACAERYCSGLAAGGLVTTQCSDVCSTIGSGMLPDACIEFCVSADATLVGCASVDCSVNPGTLDPAACVPEGCVASNLHAALTQPCNADFGSGSMAVTPAPALASEPFVSFLVRGTDRTAPDEPFTVTVGLLPLQDLRDVQLTIDLEAGLSVASRPSGLVDLRAGQTGRFAFELMRDNRTADANATIRIHAWSGGILTEDRRAIRTWVEEGLAHIEVMLVDGMRPRSSSTSIAVAAAPVATTGAADAPPATIHEARNNWVLFVPGLEENAGVGPARTRGDMWNELSNTMWAYWGWNLDKMAQVGYYQCDQPGIVRSHNNAVMNYNIPHFLDASSHPSRPTDGSPSASWTPHMGDSANHPEAHADPAQPDSTDCAPFSGHNHDASLAHLAYHVAWAVAENYGPVAAFPNSRGGVSGECVDIVAHTTGGLVLRYALQRVQIGDPSYPTWMCVQDMVTLGTPHAGWEHLCSATLTACAEAETDSPFMQAMAIDFRNPQGTGTTDWTAIASVGDTLAPVATGAGFACIPSSSAPTGCAPSSPTVFDPALRILYDDSSIKSPEYVSGGRVGNSPQFLVRHLESAWSGSAPSACSATFARPCDTYDRGATPGLALERSLAYGVWGCGFGATDDPTTLEYAQPTVGQPFTDDDCVFRVPVAAGQPQLDLRMESPSGAGRVLSVHDPAGSLAAFCDSPRPSPTGQCRFSSPSAGDWTVRVSSRDGRHPFTLRAQKIVADDLTDVVVYDAPAEVPAGVHFRVCWMVTGTGTFTSAYLEWGDASGMYLTSGPVKAGSAPQHHCDTVTAPATPGKLYLRAQAMGPNDSLLTREFQVLVKPQRDCGTDLDAGSQTLSAIPRTLDILACPGELPAGDSGDFYRVSLPAGSLLEVTLAPNPGADFDLCIYNPVGVQYCSDGQSLGGQEMVTGTASVSGNWHIEVRPATGAGPYSLTALRKTADDCNTGRDGGPSATSAVPLRLPIGS